MQSKINGNIFFPEQGKCDSIFARLSHYICLFDNTWKERIRPASVEQIKKLREVSQLGRYGIELPKAYKIYLEMMGIDDGGLLSKFFNGGTANIEDIIQIYNNLCESEPEALDTPYQIIFWCDWGGNVFIDLSGNHGDSILVVYQGETYNMVSESFEKMIFQAAFKIYEVFPNQLDFGVSIAGLKEKIQPDKVYTTLEALCLKYGLSKLWISDDKWYMAKGENINFWVCCDIAMYGRITREDKEKLNVLYKDFETLFGVKKKNVQQ